MCSVEVYSVIDLPCWMNHLLLWLHDQQALVAGTFAVAVGLFTIKAIRSQIREDKLSREDLRRRELLSLKAGATVSISEVFEYAENCIKYLKSFLGADGKLNGDVDFDIMFNEEQNAKRGQLPAYPATAFRGLEELIKYADASDGAALHEIISFSQAHRSGLTRIVTALLGNADSGLLVTTPNLFAEIRDALGLRQHMVRLFGWARTTEPHINELCSTAEAASQLDWMHLSSDPLREYVLSSWPPRSPAKPAAGDGAARA